MTTQENNRSSAVQPRWRSMLDVTSGVAMLLAAAVMTILGISLLRAIDMTKGGNGRNTTDPIPTEPLSIAGAAVVGRPDAPVALIEFSDFQKIHPLAFGAAEAAECARQQGKFWPMHDLLFGPKAVLERPALTAAAQEVHLDQSSFEQCMQSRATEAVRRDLAAGEALSIHGTPSLLVGTNRQDGTVQITTRFRGVPPGAALAASLDSALKQTARESK